MSDKKKILILDDHKNIRDLVKEFLSGDEYEVFEGKNGKEGLDILKKNSDLDVILLDLNMPEMNGFEFLDHRKEINPDIPVVVMSAYDQSEPAFKAIEKGAFTFSPKPIDFQDLQRVITKALDFRKLQFAKSTLLSFVEQETSLELPSSPEILNGATAMLKSQLQFFELQPENVEMIQSAFNNALNNAYEHGNQKDPTKKIFVKILFAKGDITIHVKDEGQGFDYSQYVDADTDMITKSKGMLLINFSMDEVKFNESGNEIIMHKKLS